MTLNATRTRLEALTKELRRNWEETKCDWRDARSQAFEAQYMHELGTRVDKTMVLLEKLEGVLGKVRNDCE